MYIYHILHREQLDKIMSSGFYTSESFQKEGYIHCSTKEQVLPTATRRYKGDRNLALLVIDPQKVEAKIIYEDTSGRGEKHPHIYGNIPVDAIIATHDLIPGNDGSFVKFPADDAQPNVKA